ncbi:MAG TPA: hypothetical protein VGV37_19315 [Aliidongia sp.]|nr:hypothetical protein [Aliidongia sp.]HEV2676684.1 hypothetical protein [Aliidongia sp.]
MKIIAWRKRAPILPGDAEVAVVRRWLAAEWVVFACISLLAAALGLGLER